MSTVINENIRIVALSGEEFQRLERLKEIREAIVEEATRDFNLDVFTEETYSPEGFSEAILSFPMMARRRVIIIRDFDKLHPAHRKKACEAMTETPDTTVIILEGAKATLSPKPPKEFLLTQNFKPIYENVLPSWIQQRFSKRGKRADHKAVAHLINNVGTVPGELDNEIEKITILSPDNNMITENDVIKVVGHFRRDTIWNLCNAIGLGKAGAAAQMLINLMETEKNKETYFISAIAGHIIKLAGYNSLRSKGISADEAMKSITESPFLWKMNKMEAQTKNFGPAQVKRAISVLTKADSTIKRFSVDKRLVMELLIPQIVPGRPGKGNT